MADKTWLGTDSGNEGDLNVAANWSPSGVPAAGDNVLFPADAPDVTDSLTALDTSTLSGALGVVRFADGFAGLVGSDTLGYMQFTTTRLEYYGGGKAYLDLEASAIAPRVYKTAAGGTGVFGLYLKGSALTTLNLSGGSVAVAIKPGETSTIATVRMTGKATLKLGAGVSLTTWYQTDGTGYMHCAATTVTVYGGKWWSKEVGAITTLNVYGGEARPESSGTITTHNSYGGATIYTGSAVARTVTTLNHNGGRVAIDKAVLTITTLTLNVPLSLTA